MSDAKSEWWEKTFGEKIGGAIDKGVDWVENKASEIKQDAAAVIDKGEDLAKAAVGEIKDDVNKAEDWAKGKVASATAAVKKEAGDLKLKAVGDQSGQPVPRPMEADCNPVHGQVPGPKNHLFCSNHGHVVDTDQKMIIAESVASYVKDGVASAVKKAGSTLDSAGKAVINTEAAAWDDTKGAYNAVTNAYDSVVPNFTAANKTLGEVVDDGEALVKKGNDKAVAAYGDVPVLGSLTKAGAALENVTAQAVGGVVKGVGDLATMGGNAILHPIDAAESLGEGALGIAEHVPIAPGLNTMVKGAHGIVDLARGKKDGEYGGSLSELGENLLNDTQRDPNDPSKRTNTDVDFLAGMGGGTKVWSEKPVEAATRTLTNIAPMLLGDEGGVVPEEGPPAPPPEGPPPEGPPPENGPPSSGPGKTQPYTKTLDLGDTQPNAPGRDPPTEVDPQDPQPDPDAPKGSPEEEALKKAEQRLADAEVAQKAAQEASIEATQDYVRYEQNDPALRSPYSQGIEWNPKESARLKARAEGAEQTSIRAIRNLEAEQKATAAARQAVIEKARAEAKAARRNK